MVVWVRGWRIRIAVTATKRNALGWGDTARTVTKRLAALSLAAMTFPICHLPYHTAACLTACPNYEKPTNPPFCGDFSAGYDEDITDTVPPETTQGAA